MFPKLTILVFTISNGIIDGELNSGVRASGSCTGTQSGVYECGGINKLIKWKLDLGNENFMIKSEFKVEKVAHTALSFILWNGNDIYHIGLDGGGNKLFYEGGSWGKRAIFVGPTNLKANILQTIVIRRIGNVLKVVVDGNDWDDLPMTASIDAVGWRPWRNTISIKTLVQISPTGNIKI